MKKIVLFSSIAYIDTNQSWFEVTGSDSDSEVSLVNLNTLFWDWFCEPKNYYGAIDITYLQKKDGLRRSRIQKKVHQMKESLWLLRLIKEKEVWVEDIVGWYFLFKEVLDFFNEANPYIQLSLDREHTIKGVKITKENLSGYMESIFWLFLRDFVSLHMVSEIDTSGENIWIYHIKYPSDFLQVIILSLLLRSQGIKNIAIYISLENMYEFIDKKSFVSYVQAHELWKLIAGVILLDSEIVTLQKREIIPLYGSNWASIVLFSEWCTHRCSFCNIWKYTISKEDIQNESYKKNVDTCIQKIIIDNLKFIWIIDPNVQPEILRYFAEQIIKYWLDIRYHIRTRFSQEYRDSDFTSLLYQSGLRYMGIGLESASPRMNHMYHKYDSEITLDEFTQVFDVIARSKINLHIYTILWWPTETKEEIGMTTQYLDTLRDRYEDIFFSYTPGMFSLLQGTIMHYQYKKYNITLATGENSFQEIFTEPIRDNNRWFVFEEMGRLAHELFLPNTEYHNEAYDFFYFIENSLILHMQKMTQIENIYVRFFTAHSRWIEPSHLYRKHTYLYNYENAWDTYSIHNSLTGRTDSVTVDYIRALDVYDPTETFASNCLRHPHYKSIFSSFIQQYILLF